MICAAYVHYKRLPLWFRHDIPVHNTICVLTYVGDEEAGIALSAHASSFPLPSYLTELPLLESRVKQRKQPNS